MNDIRRLLKLRMVLQEQDLCECLRLYYSKRGKEIEVTR